MWLEIEKGLCGRKKFKIFIRKIKYLIDNYEKIRHEMKTNQLPSKENFVNEIKNILNK